MKSSACFRKQTRFKHVRTHVMDPRGPRHLSGRVVSTHIKCLPRRLDLARLGLAGRCLLFSLHFPEGVWVTLERIMGRVFLARAMLLGVLGTRCFGQSLVL